MTDITRKRGDTYAEEWQIKSRRTGAAIDITGWTGKLTVTTIAEPPDATTKLFDIVGVITDAVKGQMEFAPTIANADQTPGTYYYDVELIDTDSRKWTYDEGLWVVEQDRTK